MKHLKQIFDPKRGTARNCAGLIAGGLALLATSAPAQSWFFNWDGTTDITCVTTFENKS